MEKITFLLLIFISVGSYAQIKEKDSTEVMEKKEEFYTNKENEYIKAWFENEVVSMKLTDTVKSEYYKILLKHTDSMTQFGDTNKQLPKDDFKKGLNGIVDRMNLKLKTLLTEKQSQQHEKNFRIILWNISIRKGWHY